MIVDIVIIAILIIAIIVGRMKGLTVCLVNLVSLILALVLAFMFYKPLGNIVIDNTEIDDNIKQVIIKNFPMNDTDFKIENTENLPTQIRDYINSTTEGLTEQKNETIENIAKELTTQVIYVLSFITIFIVVRIVLSIVKLLAKIIDKLPVFKQINNLGGAICGFVEGAIVVYIAFAIISIMSPMIENTGIPKLINDSYLGKQMYNNNLVTNIVFKK